MKSRWTDFCQDNQLDEKDITCKFNGLVLYRSSVNGINDITYKINFKLFEKIIKKLNLQVSGITNQKKFLTNLGILKRAEIISKNLPFSKKADIYYRLKRLIDKNQMGNLFKVMLITDKKTNFRAGF